MRSALITGARIDLTSPDHSIRTAALLAYSGDPDVEEFADLVLRAAELAG